MTDTISSMLADVVLSIARKELFQYSAAEPAKMMAYVISHEDHQECAVDLLKRLSMFILKYTEKMSEQNPKTNEDIDQLLVGADTCLREYLDEVITKRLEATNVEKEMAKSSSETV